MWAPKSRSFDAVLGIEFLGSRKFRVLEMSTGLPRASSKPLEVRVFSYLGYF